jgi:hypothetical protein
MERNDAKSPCTHEHSRWVVAFWALLGCVNGVVAKDAAQDGAGGSIDGQESLTPDGVTSAKNGGPTTSVSFARDVFPIVQRAGCEFCHSDRRSAWTHYTDYRTAEETYVQWTVGFGFDHCSTDGGSSIEAPPAERRLIPGSPEAGLLIRKLTEMRDTCPPFYGRMPPPPQPRLSPEQIDTIRTWIREGAKNN